MLARVGRGSLWPGCCSLCGRAGNWPLPGTMIDRVMPVQARRDPKQIELGFVLVGHTQASALRPLAFNGHAQRLLVAVDHPCPLMVQNEAKSLVQGLQIMIGAHAPQVSSWITDESQAPEECFSFPGRNARSCARSTARQLRLSE